MPHQCTNCGEVFGDGSKEMLSGCPECGNNKFQFRPAGTLSEEPSAPPSSDDAESETPTEPTSNAGGEGERVTSSGSWPDPDGAAERLGISGSDRDADPSPDESEAAAEDRPTDPAASETHSDRNADSNGDERPGLSDLRKELNDQFESIKVLSPGTYELNLMELYDREEYIISLQEDGRYVIEVPDAWNSGDDEN